MVSFLRILVVACIVVGFPLVPGTMYGQRNTVSPVVGYERGALLGIERRPGVINRFHSSGNGISYNNAFWFGIDISSRKFFSERCGLSARSGIVNTFGKFISDAYAADSGTIDKNTRLEIPTDNQFTLTATQTLFQIEALASYDVIDGWTVSAGPWGRYRILSNLLETEEVLGPTAGVFAENGTKQRAYAGDYLAGSSFRCGVLGGISRTFQLSSRLEIRPELSARLDAVALSEGLVDRRSFSFGGSLSVWFDFSLPPDTARSLAIDTLAIIASRSHIETSIDLFSADSSGKQLEAAIIQDHRTMYRQYLDLPAVVFFDRGSDNLPERYRQLRRPSDTATAAVEGYEAPLSVCHDLLNIIGRRMRDLPVATVQLREIPAPGDPASIGPRRAERVRAYLHDIWGIALERIAFADSVGNPQRDACVIIIPSTQKLIAPFLMQWIVDDRIIPNIGLNKRIVSDMGVKDWSLTLRQGSRELKRVSGRDGSNNDIDAAFSLSGLAIGSELAPLVAELEINDYAGGKRVVSDSIPLRLSGTGEKFDAETRTYILLEPMMESVGTARKALITNICSVVRDGARLLVQSDSLPDSRGWNAYSVAQSILDSMTSRGVHPLEVKVRLEPTPMERKSNEPMLPEEILLARAVRVVVEQDGVARRR